MQQWRDLRFHALQALTSRLTSARRFSGAVDAALAAIAVDPLRESGHAALMRVHLAEGNRSAALACFDAYRTLLTEELGEEPTPQLEALLRARMTRLDEPASVVLTARTAVAGEDVAAFEVVATGISMEPTIRHGDTLLVSRGIEPSPGRIVVADHDGTWIVKRIADRDGKLVLRSDNVDEEVPFADVEIHGVVVELHRTM